MTSMINKQLIQYSIRCIGSALQWLETALENINPHDLPGQRERLFEIVDSLGEVVADLEDAIR